MNAAMELALILSLFQVVKNQQLEWYILKQWLKKSLIFIQCQQ